MKRGTKEVMVKSIEEYVEWCAKMWFPTTSDYRDIIISNSDVLRDTMVGSPADLARILDECFRPLDMESVDCMYRTVLWLAFVGFPMEEIDSLRSDHVRVKQKRIFYGGEEYVLPDESLRAIHDCAWLKYFTVTHSYAKRPHKGRLKRTKLQRTSGYRLLRSVRCDQTKLANAIDSIKTAVYKAGYRVSYKRLRESGAFWRIYVRTLDGSPPDYSDELVYRMDNWKYVREPTEWDRHVRELAVLRNIRREYADWVAAFHTDTDMVKDEEDPSV